MLISLKYYVDDRRHVTEWKWTLPSFVVTVKALKNALERIVNRGVHVREADIVFNEDTRVLTLSDEVKYIVQFIDLDNGCKVKQRCLNEAPFDHLEAVSKISRKRIKPMTVPSITKYFKSSSSVC